MTRFLRPLFAAGSALAFVLAYPRFDLGWIAFAALVPLLAALRLPWGGENALARPFQAFRLGYLWGVVFFLALLHWIPRLPPENLTIPWFMIPALFLIAAYLALFPATVCLLTVVLARRGVPVWLAFPGLWLVADWLRGVGVFGFPWGATPYSVASLPHLLQFAEYTGTWGVGLWVVLINALIFGVLTMENARPQGILGLVLVALLLGPFLHGRSVLAAREPHRAVRVGLIQPNVGENKWQRAVRDSVVGVLLGQTKSLSVDYLARPPALIVWPETAIPARLPHEPIYRWQVESLVNDMGIPLLAGFPDGSRLADGTWTTSNSAGLFLPDSGMVARYDKRKLVPFSEYMPVPILDRVDFGQASFRKGDHPGVFTQLKEPFGVLICFESIFPGPSREMVGLGARYLVNITNDQWFGDSPAPYQHFAMNGLRCIENRVGMARAANTGISASIDPYGFVRESTPTFVEERIVVPVELGHGPTFYTRHGDWIVWVALLLPALGFLPGIRERSA